ncbi:hypothetical protein FRC18_011647, partial [Serendipita sp. 400]
SKRKDRGVKVVYDVLATDQLSALLCTGEGRYFQRLHRSMFGFLARLSVFVKRRKSKKTHSQTETIPTKPLQPESKGPFGSLFALIIGIDAYEAPEITPLLGAVADAREMECYLTAKLRVPRMNIQTLLDGQATRSNIIKGIQELTDNPSITRNDPILIFYAGHGTEAPSPKGWEAEQSKIEMIVPQDYRATKDGKRVGCIPDRTIGILLQQLANAKGNNITVILDCCHSGSGTRDGFRRVRSVEANEDIPDDLDIEIWGTSEGKRAKIPAEFKYHGSASHVLLAACASNQSAMENNCRGVFTQALLDTITTLGVENLTYASLIKHLPDLPGQSPRCEGKNRDRHWFTTRVSRNEPFYEVKKGSEGYVLDAGSVHSITERSEFSLYKEPSIMSTHLGKVTARSVGPLTSIVELSPGSSPDLPSPAFAIQTVFGTAKALRIHLSDDPKLKSLRDRLQHEAESNPHLYALTNHEDAKLHIGIHEDTVTFAFENSLIRTLGLDRIPFRVRLEEEVAIIKIVEAASLFIRYLNHHPTYLDVDDHIAEQGSKEPVSVYYRKLERRGRNKWGEEAHENGNLNKNYQVDVVGGLTRYGLKITNNSEEDLYPYLLLFNCNDLSITSYYAPPTVKHIDKDASLQKGGSITVGYGDGGGQPWRHVVAPAKGTSKDRIVRDEEDLQVEFFKLILSTKPVDLSFMEQRSPFDQSARDDTKLPEPVEMWNTALLTVVVRKENASR